MKEKAAFRRRDLALMLSAVGLSLLLTGCFSSSTPGPTSSTPGPTSSTPGPTSSTPGPTSFWVPYEKYKSTTTSAVTTSPSKATTSTLYLVNSADLLSSQKKVKLPPATTFSGFGFPIFSNSVRFADVWGPDKVVATYSNPEYFFYSDAGRIYKIDLTASTPTPTPLSNLSLGSTSVICGVWAQSSDDSGTKGTLFVGKAPTFASCGSPEERGYAIDFNASASTTPISMVASPDSIVGTFMGPDFSNNTIPTDGYLYTQVGTNGTTALYVTPNMVTRRKVVLQNVSSPHDVGGNLRDQIIAVPVTSTNTTMLYDISLAGVAKKVGSIPASYNLSDYGVDSAGDAFITYGTSKGIDLGKIVPGSSRMKIVYTGRKGYTTCGSLVGSPPRVDGGYVLICYSPPPASDSTQPTFGLMSVALTTGTETSLLSGLSSPAQIDMGGLDDTVLIVGDSLKGPQLYDPATNRLSQPSSLSKMAVDGFVGLELTATKAPTTGVGSPVKYKYLLLQRPPPSSGSCSSTGVMVDVVSTQDYQVKYTFNLPSSYCSLYDAFGESTQIALGVGMATAKFTSLGGTALVAVPPLTDSTATILGANSSTSSSATVWIPLLLIDRRTHARNAGVLEPRARAEITSGFQFG